MLYLQSCMVKFTTIKYMYIFFKRNLFSLKIGLLCKMICIR